MGFLVRSLELNKLPLSTMWATTFQQICARREGEEWGDDDDNIPRAQIDLIFGHEEMLDDSAAITHWRRNDTPTHPPIVLSHFAPFFAYREKESGSGCAH